MVKKFEMSAQDKKLIDNAIRRLDTIKAGKAKAAHAKAQATFKRRVKERRDAKILANRIKHPTIEEKRKLALAGWKVMLVRMEQGVWYLHSDIVALMPEYALGSVKAWIDKTQKEEFMTKAGNPDYDHVWGAGGETGSRYVYGLSADGGRMAQEWRQLV